MSSIALPKARELKTILRAKGSTDQIAIIAAFTREQKATPTTETQRHGEHGEGQGEEIKTKNKRVHGGLPEESESK